MKSVDIFPWNDRFNTGLPEIDAQHRVLVRLLNELATHVASASDFVNRDRVLAELAEHAARHFATEEAIWNEYMPDEQSTRSHREWHQDFTKTLERLKGEQPGKPLPEAAEETLATLTRHLTTHMLEYDLYCARVVLDMRAGLSREAALAQAGESTKGAVPLLTELLLSAHGSLTANTVRLLSEIAERKHAELALQESEERLRTIVEQSPVGIILHRDGHVMQVNEAAVRMFGYGGRAAMLGTDVFDNIAPENRAEVQDLAYRRLRGEDANPMYETVGLRRDGSRFPLVLVPRRMQTAEGPVIGAFLMDVTERERAERTERALHRTVKLLSRCNGLLVRAPDEQDLLSGVCRMAVEVGGYRLAWVGYAEHDADKSLRPVAQFGDGARYVASARASWGDNARGQGPGGSAVRGGRTAISHDIEHNPRLAPWHAAAREHGYRSAIALPLKVERETIGVLAIYSADPHGFGAEEVALLEELASDLSFGIEALRLRAAKAAAVRDLERESNKNRALLHNASDGVHVLDEHGHLIEASDSFCAMLGYAREELMGMRFSDWDAGDWEPGAREALFRQALDGDRRLQFHTRHRRRDGSIIDVEVSAFPLTVEGKRMLFNSSRDVTESRRVRAQLEHTTRDLRTLLAEFESSLEAERTHIAREVHDELGQILTSLGFAISTIRVKFGKDNPELLGIAREMSALNERALQVARNVAENLRPAILNMGIVPAVEWLCDRIRAQTGLRCDFRASKNLGDMDQALVDAVFRIAQESLTNAMRHAQASRLGISLTLREDGLHLTVHDDGKGFEPARAVRPRSFGLRGMEERVRSLGGAFHVTSAPGAGTTVSVHMPYQRMASSGEREAGS